MTYLWLDPSGQTVAANRQDTLLFEWAFAHAARIFTDGADPFATQLMNMPNGVNMLANTTMLAIGIPMVPVTLLAGPQYSLLIVLTLAPAATATSWYLVLNRNLGFSRTAAFVSGLICGYSPAMVSQTTAHPNVAAQFLFPLIVLTVLRMRISGRWLRTGLELAALVVVQAFINEELLFLTALTMAVFIAVMAMLRPAEVLRHVGNGARVAAVAAVAAGALLAYPLYRQFTGAMAYKGIPPWAREYGTDVLAFSSYATESLGGGPNSAAHLAQGAVEENTFFGWGLLVLIAAIVIWQRRDRLVVALAVTGGLFAVFSIGPKINIRGEAIDQPGPWKLFTELPILDSVVPTRMGLVLTPIVALLVGIGLDRVRRVATLLDRQVADRASGEAVPISGALIRRLAVCALAVALVPIAPTPIETTERPAAPEFFASGLWRNYLPAGAVVVPVAPGWDENMDVMQWQLAAKLGFATSGGYFLAPVPDSTDKVGIFGPAMRPTAGLLVEAASKDHLPDITAKQRDQAVTDIRYWKATTMLMRDNAHGANGVRATMDKLVGAGRHVADVWIWDVRGLR